LELLRRSVNNGSKKLNPFFNLALKRCSANQKTIHWNKTGRIQEKDYPGANPTIVCYNASAVKIYNATGAF
jgi:hypothetical protein